MTGGSPSRLTERVGHDEITASLVARLVADQFPRWAGLPVRPVERQGNDNRSFRLGDHLCVRVPSGPDYVAGVEKETRAIPIIAEHVSVSVPEVVASGLPTQDFGFPWSVRRWIEGDVPSAASGLDRRGFAADLGTFLAELRRVPPDGGPACGAHSFYRGAHPSCYADQVEAGLRALDGLVDTAACRRIWAEAMRTVWQGRPVWFHGDVAEGNLLVRDGRLAAVIDFGTCGVGDPACDLVIAWTWMEPAEVTAFAAAVDLDDDTWARARGWALWKAVVTLAWPTRTAHDEAHRQTQHRALGRLLA